MKQTPLLVYFHLLYIKNIDLFDTDLILEIFLKNIIKRKRISFKNIQNFTVTILYFK